MHSKTAAGLTMMPKIRRIHILGLPVDCVDMQTAIQYADQCVRESRRPCPIIAMNPEKVIAAGKNDQLRTLISQAALVLPDGYGIVLAARLARIKNITRVPGCEFMQELCRLATEKRYKVFLYGGRPEVNEQIEATLIDNMNGINIVGRCHGFISQSEQPALIDKINALDVQILFVALGSPTQEEWIRKYVNHLTTVKVIQGVGGTFDVLTGHVNRAPAFFIKLNLEWLYRLLVEPTRLRRQLALPLFAWLVFKERAKSLLA